MLTRVSCEEYGFLCLWTDDPKGFLRASCRKPARCEAGCRMQIDAGRAPSSEGQGIRMTARASDPTSIQRLDAAPSMP